MKTLNISSIIIAILMISSISSSSQNFHYGIKAGVNLAVQSEIANYFDNNNIRSGLSAGAYGNYGFNNWFMLQTEVNYDQKGGKSETITSRYDYLTIPVLAKFSLGKSDQSDLKFNINLGPYAGFLLNAENEVEGVTTDMKDNTEGIEFGAIGGFGLSYPISNNKIVFDVRMGLGLTSYDMVDSDPSNKYIGITLGYEF